MKKRMEILVLILTLSVSMSACGSQGKDTGTGKTAAKEAAEAPAETPDPADTETPEEINIDMDKCIADLKDNLPLEPDYSFVRDYTVSFKDGTIIFSAVIDDAADPSMVLEFADTLVRQLNLYASMQDSSIKIGTKDNYGGLYDIYTAMVGIAPASKVEDSSEWFIYDAISSSKASIDLNKIYK